MVLSRMAAARLADCACATPDTPDDMHLGRCAARAGIPLTHTNRSVT